jgi:hypothetical protein
MMDGVLRQVELAALPDGAAEHGFASGLEAGMIVGGDELDAAHAARDQVFQEGAPVNFSFGDGNRHAENTAAAIWTDPECRQNGSVTHDTTLPGFLIASVQEEVANFAERSATPGLQLVIEQLGGAADLRR